MNRSLVFLYLALFIPFAQPALVSAVPVSSGDIFFDDYTSAAGALSSSEANYDQVNGTITRDGTTLATTTADLGGTHFFRSKLLDFSSSSNEWVASVRFRVNGTLNTVPSGAGPRQFHLLNGTNSPSPLGSDSWEAYSFDLRLDEIASDTNGTGSTYDLKWFGWDNLNTARVAQTVSGGSGLNKSQFYDVTLHRKPNDMFDIYLDGILIDTKALIVGAGGGSNPGAENPKRLMFGDASGLILADVTVDSFSIGSVFVEPTLTPIPEPGSGMIWLAFVVGIASWRKYRQRAQ